ncbi:hypothetical protein V9T40_012745 [Parthenolecanium corni]|uniref:Glycylpeptide N-tetradecanoyltransferase n=1 Tax=Parthenolecanium corni TaxID=536013 RepID=A0AAN9T9A9_9HEMI
MSSDAEKTKAAEAENQVGSTEQSKSQLLANDDIDGKKKSKDQNTTEEIVRQDLVNGVDINCLSVQDLKRAMEVFSLAQKPARTPDEAMQKSYEFWNTQPVPKMDEPPDEEFFNGPIEPDQPLESVRPTPYSLPVGFRWDTLNVNDSAVLKELYTLLNENYVEDEDSMFRFDYQPDFLKWALQPPGWMMDWHVGVRVTKNDRLVGFISAIPATLSIYSKKQKVVEINFLCVHKKLRSKRVAPVLIREITRRVHQRGINQAVYTAGVILPKPVGTCRYWHRSLNPKKLIEVKFSHLSRNMTMQRTLRLFKLPDSSEITGFRKLVNEDVPKAHKLLQNYLEKFNLVPVFTEEEFKHWFIPRPGIVDTYIVEGKNNEITDMVSFYTLPSTVMHHPNHKSVKAAYSFYNVAKGTKLIDLMRSALIAAKNDGFDVFNALDLMENKAFLEELKFGMGDGNLQYYLYNWKCPPIPPEKIGLVLQ